MCIKGACNWVVLLSLSQEMASDELKEMRKNLTKEAIREHQMAKTGGTQTDLFTCGKCKKKNCTYTQVCGYYRLTQTRGLQLLFQDKYQLTFS